MSTAPVLVVVGPKGGVGKTTIAAHVAAAFGTTARPAIAADLDPQGALTDWLLVEPTLTTIAADLDAGRPLKAYPAPNVPGLLVAPADIELAAWDQDFERTRGRMKATLRAPAAALLVADCPPSWGALVAGALLVADFVIVAVEARHLGLAGLERMLDLIDRAREQNPRLRLLGIVPSRVGRTRLAAETVQRLRDRYRATLPPIRDFVRIAERPRSHATVYQSPDDHPAKDDFRALAAAIRRRMKETKS